MLNRKMMRSWTLCWIIKLTTSSSKHHLELQAKMWIARPCLVLGDPAPATVRRPSTKSIFEKSASFWESSCGFQTFICLQTTSLLPKSWEGLHLFSRLRQREWFPPKLIWVRVLFIPVYCYQVLNSVGLNMKRFVFKSHHRHFQKQRYLFKRGKRLMFDGGQNPIEPRTLVAFPRSCECRPW